MGIFYVDCNIENPMVKDGSIRVKIDEVVFGEDKDLSMLGSRTLEGFPAIVDARRKKLVVAGPLVTGSYRINGI
ncbi:MAG: hypothetical protein AB1297_07400 [bacterium]